MAKKEVNHKEINLASYAEAMRVIDAAQTKFEEKWIIKS